MPMGLSHFTLTKYLYYIIKFLNYHQTFFLFKFECIQGHFYLKEHYVVLYLYLICHLLIILKSYISYFIYQFKIWPFFKRIIFDFDSLTLSFQCPLNHDHIQFTAFIFLINRTNTNRSHTLYSYVAIQE